MTFPEIMSIVIATISGSGAIIGTVVWGIRLEGKVDKEYVRTDDLKELINTKIDLMNLHVCQRLDRIERALNGSLKAHEND